MKTIIKSLLCCSILWINVSYAADKMVAITIDDLPFVGSLHYAKGNLHRENDRFLKIVEALDSYQVPAIGFVIAGSIAKGQMQLLELFEQHGYLLGNHTYSHWQLRQNNVDKYIKDITKADAILTPLMTNNKRYFRYPYLAEGRNGVKERVHNYLAELNYKIAPVTIDSKDFQFNAQFLSIPWRSRPSRLNALKKRYLSYIWAQTLRAEKHSEREHLQNKQILLIHANVLNSLCLNDILKMYKDKGYQFISLEEALKKEPLPSKKAVPAKEKPPIAVDNTTKT